MLSVASKLETRSAEKLEMRSADDGGGGSTTGGDASPSAGRRGSMLLNAVVPVKLLVAHHKRHKFDVRKRDEREQHERFQQSDVVLGCLRPSSPTRRLACKLVLHRFFERAILVCIVLSSALLALQDPASELPTWQRASDAVFSGFFVVEMLLKVLHKAACHD